MLKWIPFFPIDPTILFGIPVAGILIKRIIVFKYQLTPGVRLTFFGTLFFFIWYLFSATYSISDIFWVQKFLGMLLNIISFIFPILCLKKWEEFLSFNRFLAFLSILTIFAVLALKLSGNIGLLLQTSSNRLSDGVPDFPDYLNLGTIIGFGVLIFLSTSRRIHFLLAMSGIAALVVIGARGPFLFTVIMIVVHILYRYKDKILTLRFYFYLLGVLVCIWGLLQWEGASLLVQRLSVHSYRWGSSELDNVFRIPEFTIALNVISDFFFFGTGLGGYGLAGYGIDDNIYPHNILLEVFSETGLFGFVLFCICLLSNVPLFTKCFKTRLGAVYVILTIYIFLNFMKSGGFIGGRYFFVYLGLVASYSNYLALSDHDDLTNQRIL